MTFQITARADCVGDNCPTLQVDPATGDVYAQGYLLSEHQLVETDVAGGALPTGEGRLRIPSAVFDELVAQHQGR